MKCSYHPEIEAVGACVNCGRLVCQDCQILVSAKSYCKPCNQSLSLNNNRLSKSPAANLNNNRVNDITTKQEMQKTKPKKHRLLSILSLVFGVIGIFWWPAVLGILAIILGSTQLLRYRGKLAIVGLVLGVIDILLAFLWYRAGLMPSMF